MSDQERHSEVSNSMAEAGFEQARKALENFLDGARQIELLFLALLRARPKRVLRRSILLRCTKMS